MTENRFLPPKPIHAAAVWAPRVLELRGDSLLCDLNHYALRRLAGSGLLQTFISLTESGPEDIFRFAHKWGALAIERIPQPGLRFLEPIRVWSDLSRRLSALQRIGAALNVGKVGSDQDWIHAGSDPREAHDRISAANPGVSHAGVHNYPTGRDSPPARRAGFRGEN